MEVLGIIPWENPTERDGQGDLVRAVGIHKSVSTRSGHKTGKSITAAGLAWWFWATHVNARAVVTAPTDRQVKRVIWREIALLQRRSKKPLEADVPKDPSTGILSPDGREIFGFTAGDPDAFSGISSENVLYLVDEAPGVSEDMFEALEGNRAGGAKLVMLGNPTQPAGTFWNSHHTEREFFHCLHLSSEDAADYGMHNGERIPGLAVREWCDEMARKWGRKSPLYDIRVAGNYPRETFDTVISLWLVQAASERWADMEEEGLLVIGVDPAREGDDESIIQPRIGKKLLMPIAMQGKDGVQVGARAIRLAHELVPKGQEVVTINVDEAGIGASVVDHIAYSEDDICEVVGVNSSRKSDDEEMYHNVRAQLHYGMRDFLKDGGALPPDPKLEADLLAPKYKFDSRNRLQVEKKEEIKKRIKRSPDRGDAAQLAVYGPGMQIPDDITDDIGDGSRWGHQEGRGF